MFCAIRPAGPTRVLSPRQLPTNHDYAVPTRDIRVINRRIRSSLPSVLLLSHTLPAMLLRAFLDCAYAGFP